MSGSPTLCCVWCLVGNESFSTICKFSILKHLLFLIFEHHLIKFISNASQTTWCLIWVMIELLYYALELGGLKLKKKMTERLRQLRCWVCLTELLLWREKRMREFVVCCFCLYRQPCLRILLFIWEFSFVFFVCLCLPPFLSLRLLWSHWPLKRRSGKKREKIEREAEVIVSSSLNLVRCNCWQTANLHNLNIFAYVHPGEAEKNSALLLNI